MKTVLETYIISRQTPRIVGPVWNSAKDDVPISGEVVETALRAGYPMFQLLNYGEYGPHKNPFSISLVLTPPDDNCRGGKDHDCSMLSMSKSETRGEMERSIFSHAVAGADRYAHLLSGMRRAGSSADPAL